MIEPYPVHRQMLPRRKRASSARCWPVSAAAVMIMPGVQNPHWNPWAATNAWATGCGPRPSMVVTARPAARTAG